MLKLKSLFTSLAVAALLFASAAQAQLYTTGNPDLFTHPVENGTTAVITSQAYVDKKVSSEYERAKYAEAGLQGSINTEAKRTEAAREVLRKDIVATNATVLAEKIRAMGAESDLSDAVKANAKFTTAVEANGAKALQNEANRAVAAEAQLQASKASTADVSAAVGKVYTQSTTYTDKAVLSETAARNVADAAIRAEAYAQGVATSKAFAVVNGQLSGLQSEVVGLKESVKETQEAGANSLAIGGIPTCAVGSCFGIGYGNTLGRHAVALGATTVVKAFTLKAAAAKSGGTVGVSLGASRSF